MNRVISIAICLLALSFAAAAQTADEIVSKYFQKIGGVEKLKAIQTVRTTSKFVGGGGFEAVIVGEGKRPNMVRQDFLLQGFAAISAYDGKTGWKINPFGGKKDAEALSEEEMKQMVEDSDFDGPLMDYAKKGNKVEFVGKEEFEGDDVYKLKVTLANGTVKHFYMDTEYYVPLKIETRQTVRGTEFESETIFGDYKEVGGIYYAFSVESGPKGSSNKSTVTVQKIEVNIPIDDSRFAMPKK
ncbi:MAG: outer membrane lipoprotein-sorting protein [Pyrinomonadaceae bacterium]